MYLGAALSVAIFGISLIAMPFVGTKDASAQVRQQRVQSLLASFSGSLTASSLVKGITVTGLNATGNNTIFVSLKHAGPENTPGVRVMTAALSIPEKDITLDLGSILKTLASSVGAANTQTPPQPSVPNPTKALLQPLKIATGNTTLIAGWKSPSNVFVHLRGNTTLGEANVVSVGVLPLTGR